MKRVEFRRGQMWAAWGKAYRETVLAHQRLARAIPKNRDAKEADYLLHRYIRNVFETEYLTWEK